MDPLESFKAAQKLGWAHFAPLETFTTPPAAQLVKRAGIVSGSRVLDVACGTGVVAVTAARLGASVTGLDLTPELLTRARENSRIAGVEIDWREGDVEALPFESATFDVVVSWDKFEDLERNDFGRTYVKCLYHFFICVLNANGDLCVCMYHLDDQRFTFGNIYLDSIEEIWNSRRRQEPP